MWRRFLVCVAATGLLGCGAPPSEEGGDGGVTDRGYTPVTVYYATDRARSGDDDPNKIFGSERRNRSGKWALEFGECIVTIPERHREGELERPTWWKLEFREDVQKHVVLKEVTPIGTGEFLSTLREDLAVDDSMIVFVHGFNVTFADAARRSAQIKYDLAFEGPVAFFSWPAPVNYVVCKENADWASPHLAMFLTDHVSQTGAKKVHLIAHSMGSRVLSNALKELAHDKPDVKYNQIVLAAPDIDASTFKEHIAPKIIGSGDQLSIYASSQDEALIAARRVQGGYDRLGEGGDHLTTFPDLPIDVIDATAITESMLGHSYYGDSVYFLRELRKVFDGVAPLERGLTAAQDHYVLAPPVND